MRQAQPHDPHSGRTTLAALAGALLAVLVIPAGAGADGLTVPHADAPKVPTAVGSRAPSGSPAPAPSSGPGPSAAPSGESGDSSASSSDSVAPAPFGQQGDYGIPDFRFPRPEKPPSGSPDCGPGCEEQWGNYFTAAAQAAGARANETTDPDEADTMGALATALASHAATAYERRDSEVNEAAQSATAPSDTSAAQAVEQEEEIPPDAVPLGWLVPSTVDLSQNPLVMGAVDMLEALSGIFGPDGTTVCSKEAKPDGKLPICAE